MKDPNKLTKRQQMFVAAFVVCLNGAEAARRAGYAKSSANVMGSQLLANPNIKALIEREYQNRVMSEGEVLTRFSDIARADIGEIVSDEDDFSLSEARQRGVSRFIKKIRRTTTTDEDGNTTRTTEVELYSAMEALVNLAKYHNLFKTTVQLTDWRDKIVDGLRKKELDPETVRLELGDDLARELLGRAGLSGGESGQSPQVIENAQAD